MLARLALPLATAIVALGLGVNTPAQTHTHGSMVGTLRSDSVIVWTRASGQAQVSVRYGTDPTLQTAKETAALLVTAATDYTFKAKLVGLSPATRYYYATRVAGKLGPIGRFETAPRATQNVPVSFLFGADVKVTYLSSYTTFDRMRAHGTASFYVSMGDMPYADGAQTIAEFRAKHRAVRNSPKWWRFLQDFPVEATVDDHEVVNGWDARTNKTQVANGLAVFKEYYPFPPGTSEIYRSIPWGKALEVFVLDTRTYRSANGSPTTAGKTMLGATQKQWLLKALEASTATFKVVVTSVPLRHGSAADGWDGHARERQEILRFLLAKKIRNVVFLTGDRHYASVHHHREGVREYMVGPVAQFLGTPPPSDLEMRWRARALNYGLVTVDPLASPPTLTVEIHGTAGLLKKEVLRAEEPATLRFVGDEQTGGLRMVGPAFYRNRGARVGLDHVEAGRYRVTFDAVPTAKGGPTPIDLDIPPGSEVAIAADWRDVQTDKVLFADTFEKWLSGYTVLDETTASGPSAWFTDQGYLLQSSNINGAGAPSTPGTILWTGNTAWTDYTVSVRARPQDNDAFGVVFRFVDKDNYYRFSMDAQRSYRRLVRKVKGTFQVLAEDKVPYSPNNWVDIQAVAIGNRLKIFVGEEKVFEVVDGSHGRGAVGLFTWANLLTYFEDLVVTAGDTAGRAAPGHIASDDFADGRFSGWSVEDHGNTSAPSNWFESGGVLRQTSNIHTPTSPATKISRPGTVATLQTTRLKDFEYSVRIRSGDDDSIGAVFRYRDAGNTYRFAWDSERRFRRLTKAVGGKWTVLVEDDTPYTPGQWYDLRCVARGNRITVFVDEELFADLQDSSIPDGWVGVYCWANDDAAFDRVLIRQPPAERAVLTAITAPANMVTDIRGLAPASAGELYGLAMAFGRAPGIPLSILNATDPRTLDLTPDFLFFESLKPSPIWSNFHGKLGAGGTLSGPRIRWPNLAALRGTIMYVGGWTGDVTRGNVREVMPTVAIRYP